jgi:S1-C subfamily serine protease
MNSQVKQWDSLDEGIKKRQIGSCIYNMNLICSPFAKAYDEPDACKALMKLFVDPAKKMTILDYRKRIAKHYLRRIQEYRTNRIYGKEYLKELEVEAKENFLNQLDEIVNLGFSTQAQILQAQLDEIINNTQKHSSSQRSGTGWFINPTHIVTCWHVVENTSEQTIVYENGAKVKAKIIAYDSGSDIAILSVSPQSSNDSFLTIQTRIARISDKVFTIGFPIPSLLGSSQKYTEGTISATKGIGNDSRFYQISTPLQPGNSGGALVNEAGEVIGITAAMLDSLSTALATGTLSQNVNYAIKIRSLVALLDDNGIKYSTSSNQKISTSVDNLVDSVSKATVLIKAE